jgi:hypothetical protein
MDKIESLIRVLRNGGMKIPPSPIPSLETYHIAQGVVGLNHVGVTGVGTDACSLHTLGIYDVVLWKNSKEERSPRGGQLVHYRLPPNVCVTTQKAWMYLVCNFGVWDKEVVPGEMASTLLNDHAHLKKEGGLVSLEILDLLASYLQRTSYEDATFLHHPTTLLSLSYTASHWFSRMSLETIEDYVWVGEAVTCAAMSSSHPSHFPSQHSEVWVSNKEDAHEVLKIARECFYDIVAGCRITSSETLVLIRWSHPIPPLYVRVVPQNERARSLMEVQPDFCQSMWHPRHHEFTCTPRCRRAMVTNVCILSPFSSLESFAKKRGFLVKGKEEERKEDEDERNEDKVWMMLRGNEENMGVQLMRLKHKCSDVSSRKENDWMLSYWYRDDIDKNKYDVDLKKHDWFPETRSYFDIKRVWVKKVEGRFLTITRPHDAPLTSLFYTLHAHLSNVLEDNDEMMVDVGDAQIVHGMTHDELKRVPVGCSLSGTMWFTGQLTMSPTGYRVVTFQMLKVYVHPSHLPSSCHPTFSKLKI